MKGLEYLLTNNKSSMIFGILVPFTAILNNKISSLFIYISTCLLILYFICWLSFLVKEVIKKNKWYSEMKFPIYYKEVKHDWRLSADGDFHGNINFTIINSSNKQVTSLPFDNAYWLTTPKKIDIDFKVKKGQKHNIKNYRHSIFNFFVSLFLNKTINAFQWSHEIDPPLMAGEEFSYDLIVDTPETEKDAFSDEGTYAGIPVVIPTKNAYLSYVAPIGYYFEILDPVILVDSSGNRYHEEEININHPKLNHNKSILTWAINNPLSNRRYWFKYKMCKE